MHTLDKAQTSAVQYWFVDGLAEITAGLVSLFLAVLFWSWQYIAVWRWSLLVLMLAGLVVSFGLRLIIQRIKERSTYRQSGYAAPYTGLERRGSTAAVIIFSLLLIGGNYVLSTRGPQALLWTPALAGVVFAFLFAWTAALTRLRRFYLLALVSLGTGVVAALLGLEETFRGVAILAAVVGLVLLVFGCRTRKAYLHQTAAINGPVHG